MLEGSASEISHRSRVGCSSSSRATNVYHYIYTNKCIHTYIYTYKLVSYTSPVGMLEGGASEISHRSRVGCSSSSRATNVYNDICTNKYKHTYIYKYKLVQYTSPAGIFAGRASEISYRSRVGCSSRRRASSESNCGYIYIPI